MRFFRLGSNSLIALTLLALGGSLSHTPGALRQHYGTVFLGLSIFFVLEYLMHRYLLHWPRSQHPLLRDIQRRLHYGHHEAPDRVESLFLLPWFTVLLIGAFGGLYYAIIQNWLTTQALLFGNLSGLLYYERVHYVAHTSIVPRTAWGRYMKKYHLWHHYKNENHWYGVTNPLGDLLCGTWNHLAEVDKSPTARQWLTNRTSQIDPTEHNR